MLGDRDTLDIYTEWVEESAKHTKTIQDFLAGEDDVKQDYLQMLYVSLELMQSSSHIMEELKSVLLGSGGKLDLERGDKLATLAGEMLAHLVQLILELGFDINDVMAKSIRSSQTKKKKELTST